MRTLIILLFLFSYHFSIGQADIKLVSVLQSQCDMDADIDRIQPRIIKQSYNNDTLVFSIGTVTNCGGISQIKTYYINDTVYITYEEGETYIDTIFVKGKMKINKVSVLTTCQCCFEFQFTISDLLKEPKAIKINNIIYNHYPVKYKVYPVTYDIENDDTINYSDKFGLKQGWWNKIENKKRYYDSGNVTYEYTESNENFDETELEIYDYKAFFIDNVSITEELKEFDLNGQLQSIYIKSDSNQIRNERYYESGQMEFQSITNQNNYNSISTSFFKNGNIKRVYIYSNGFSEIKYYKNGQLKKLRNNTINQDFYSNGILKHEGFLIDRKDNIIDKYFYDNGNIMLIHYLKRKEGYPTKQWSKCFDIKGKKITREYLIKQGYKEILDLH